MWSRLEPTRFGRTKETRIHCARDESKMTVNDNMLRVNDINHPSSFLAATHEFSLASLSALRPRLFCEASGLSIVHEPLHDAA